MGDERRQPKYAAIAADLDLKIQEGHYASGQALPSQRDLSAEYGVTLMTLRQALSLLAERGLVTREAGRGTYVSPPKAFYSMGSLKSLADDLREQGHSVETTLLARGRRPLPAWVATRLGAEAAEPALRVERLRHVGGAPAIHQVSWIPAAFAGSLTEVDFTATSLYDAFAADGRVADRADERLSPAVLTTRLGTLLERPEGAPVFLSDRVTYDRDGHAIVFDRATILGELIEIRTERAASSVKVVWTNAGG
ncbi:GntR family transcriptional regulator [Amycolatopsis sp. NPDC059657]|uniref:GntR family transcriptional regulator n=1 Tax=Amycolatopsis sp. NPDC059657 TaxID=3346899 RepID=UPI00366D7562